MNGSVAVRAPERSKKRRKDIRVACVGWWHLDYHDTQTPAPAYPASYGMYCESERNSKTMKILLLGLNKKDSKHSKIMIEADNGIEAKGHLNK